MNKQIAIFGWKTGENSYGITVPYYDYFNSFGDVNILSPIEVIDFEKYDLIVVPGGSDINPVTYGHIPDMSTGRSDPIKEYFDVYHLPLALKSSTPVVGVCRGHQSVAVHYNAALDQDMYHATNPSNDRIKRVHEIDIFASVLPKPLQEAVMREITEVPENKKNLDPTRRTQKVNSIHHQSIANVPAEARLLATHFDKDSPDDHTIEALYYPKAKAITFQYHPEEIWDKFSRICVSFLLSIKEIKQEHEAVQGTFEIQG